jgi:glycosyltransferase involved in cell wall biosynthesis
LLLKRSKFDLIISHTPEASYIASLFNKPFIHIFHGNKNALTKSIFWYGKYFKWVFDYFEKRIIKKAAKLYTVGEYRENAEKFCNPIDLQITTDTEPKDRKDFVFAGRLEEMKRIDAIIEVYNSLPESYKANNNLHIIGIGTQEIILRKLAVILNLHEKVIFHGLLPNERAIGIISKSSILLMSSTHEGFPMVIAESLSVGTPVISTDVGDIRSVIKNGVNGFLLPTDYEQSEYAGRIIELLSNYKQFSDNAFESSVVFNAKEIASKFINECKELIKNAKQSQIRN